MEENEIKNTLKKISEEIELLKDEARKKGLAFYAPSLEQLEKKLRSVNTPFIKMVMWTSNGHISDQFIVRIFVFNPDPNPISFIYAYFFFGPATIIPDIGTALLSAYSNLPRLYAVFARIDPNSTQSVEFNYRFPFDTTSGINIGNLVIFKTHFVSVGEIIERSTIDVSII